MDFSSIVPKIFGSNKSSDDEKPKVERRTRTTQEQRLQNPTNLMTTGDAIIDRKEAMKKQLDDAEE
jgi:hypothetical protein